MPFTLSLWCLMFLILKACYSSSKEAWEFRVLCDSPLCLKTHTWSASRPWPIGLWFVSFVYTPFPINFVAALIQGSFTVGNNLLNGFFLFPLYSKPNILARLAFLKEIHPILPLLF